MKLFNLIFDSMDVGIYFMQADARKNVKPYGLVVRQNIKYGPNPYDNVFDVFYPQKLKDKKLQTVLHIHGGGYVAGAKEQRERYCMLLAKKGYCVINMEYSNAKKVGFPGPVKDVYGLFDYLQADDSVNCHIDFDNFFISGDSAGAHVATLIANAQTNPNFKKKLGVAGGPQIKGCLLTSPSLKMFDFKSSYLTKMFRQAVLGGDDVETANLVDMTKNISSNFPPTIIISAGNDFLKEHACQFCETAKQLKIPAQHFIFVSAKHLLHDFTTNYPHLAEGQYAINRFDNFIKMVTNNQLLNMVVIKSVNLKGKCSPNNIYVI